jgi:hypothetical protein
LFDTSETRAAGQTLLPIALMSAYFKSFGYLSV